MRSLLNEYLELTEASIEQRIQKALGKYQFDQDALADYIGVTAKKVGQALADMNSKGMVVKVKRTGIWHLDQ